MRESDQDAVKREREIAALRNDLKSRVDGEIRFELGSRERRNLHLMLEKSIFFYKKSA